MSRSGRTGSDIEAFSSAITAALVDADRLSDTKPAIELAPIRRPPRTTDSQTMDSRVASASTLASTDWRTESAATTAGDGPSISQRRSTSAPHMKINIVDVDPSDPSNTIEDHDDSHSGFRVDENRRGYPSKSSKSSKSSFLAPNRHTTNDDDDLDDSLSPPSSSVSDGSPYSDPSPFAHDEQLPMSSRSSAMRPSTINCGPSCWSRFVRRIRPLWQFRYALVLMCALSVVISYADRSNLSVAVLEMEHTYKWSNSSEGWVLGSFFYGYTGTQVLGGFLADKFGGERVLGAGVFLWSLFTLLTPVAADLHMYALLACRVCMGLGEGVGFPAILSIVSRWIPIREQSTATAVAVSASYVGTVFALELSPLLDRKLGWRMIFYFFGAVGFAWWVGWMFFPIRKRGRRMLTESTASLLGDEEGASSAPAADAMKGESANEDSVKLSVPWKRLFSKKEVWAIIVNQFLNSWGFYVLLNYLPKYFNAEFNVNIENSSSFTVYPFIAQGLLGIASGVVADWMLHTRGFKVRTVRRLMQCSGVFGSGVFLLLAIVLKPTVVLATVLLTCALGLNALTLAGVSVSQLDIAPKYAGTVYGMGNTAACLPGLIAVPLTGWMLDGHGGFQLVFAIACSFYFLGGILWFFMCGGKPVVD